MTVPHMPMMNDEGLLECPFCGSMNVFSGNDGKHHYVWCDNCGCGTGYATSEESAVKKWNTREGNIYTEDDFKQAAMEREYGFEN